MSCDVMGICVGVDVNAWLMEYSGRLAWRHTHTRLPVASIDPPFLLKLKEFVAL